jgi:hypothetical protein
LDLLSAPSGSSEIQQHEKSDDCQTSIEARNRRLEAALDSREADQSRRTKQRRMTIASTYLRSTCWFNTGAHPSIHPSPFHKVWAHERFGLFVGPKKDESTERNP